MELKIVMIITKKIKNDDFNNIIICDRDKEIDKIR